MGYFDRLAGRGFASEYATAIPAWQRNYESGRLWATGMLEAGIEAPEWPTCNNRVPQEIHNALAEVRSLIGPSRPEDEGVQPEDPDLVVLVVVPRLVGRRIVERVAA